MWGRVELAWGNMGQSSKAEMEKSIHMPHTDASHVARNIGACLW